MGAIHQALLAVPVSGGLPTAPWDDTNMELWLRVSSMAGVSDGNPIAAFTDISGHGRHGTQSTESARATYHATGGSNNKPYASFDGNDGYELPDFLTGFAAGRIFIVPRAANDPAASTATCIGPISSWSSAGGGADNFLYPFTDGVIHDSFGSTVRHNTGNPTLSLTSWRLYEALSKSGTWTNWIDGTQHFTTGTNTVGWGVLPRIGFDGVGNSFLGDFHELIFFGADIDSTVIADVKSYLAAEYALTIA